MIRSLGSSLLAKAGTGSLTRKKDETRITKPDIPGKGAVGTAGRDLTQETNITPVAPGSEKVIRSAPGIESASLPGMAANQVPLVAGIGLNPGMVPGAGANRPSAANQAMFQGGAPASQEGQAGRQATTGASTGQVLGSVATSKANRAAEAARAAQGESAQVQAERVPFGQGSLPDIGIFGGRVSAEEGGNTSAQPTNTWQPTAGQYVSGAIGKAINTIGQKLGNILPEKNISEQLQNFGGAQSVAAAGKGSIGSALRSVVQQATNTWNKLRSKFGR